MARDLLLARHMGRSSHWGWWIALGGALSFGCGSAEPSAGSGSGGGLATGGSAAGGAGGLGTGGTSGAGGSAWTNPGCTAAKNVASHEFEKLSLEIDLTGYASREYGVRETVTLRPEATGTAVTLFGTALLLGEASHGYAYDGQAATFCVEPFQAGEPVTLSVSYVVSQQTQNLPEGNVYGIHVWGDPGTNEVIGAYSAPFFAATWMLAPNTMPWIDKQHSGAASLDAAELKVKVPDASWSVVGAGLPEVGADTWKFSIQGRMPVYSLAFAASPHFVPVSGTPTASGLDLLARVMPANETKIVKHLAAARGAVDWMQNNIAPYSWPTSLTFAEVPGYPGGFEHTSGVWLGSIAIDGDNEGDYVATHETVHHWFGNDVQADGWSHFWLSEGFVDSTTVFGITPGMNPTYAAARQKKYRTEAATLSYPSKAGDPLPGPLRFPDDGDFSDQLTRNGQLFYRYGAAFLEMVNQRLKRDHGTDLISVLASWYAASHASSVTTEQFRDFLIANTGEGSWSKLFDEWVYVTPCPTLELGNYSFANGLLSFEIRRVDGANQDLAGLEIALGAQQATSIDLPSGVNLAKLAIPMASAPTGAIAIDPKGFYILRLTTESGWLGPAVQNTLP